MGGLMAGTRCGRLYNTYPLMNGQFMPDGTFHKILGQINGSCTYDGK
ncbi:MAG: hypothetical protein IPL12_21430 [Bacteroidetes bacterium]|nr:hypothetical protein [Bacteroidota bacterium]